MVETIDGRGNGRERLRSVVALLAQLFGSSDNLFKFIRKNEDWDERRIINSMPGTAATFIENVDGFVNILWQNGQLNARFFAWLRATFPGQALEIDNCAAQWINVPEEVHASRMRQEKRSPQAPKTVAHPPGTDNHDKMFRTRLSVDASDAESSLGIEALARALALTLDRCDGGVCFGVFGHWGRGKTFLMRRLERLLPRLDELEHRYEVVWFSAWKYPTVPEVWVHLYETMARKAYSGGLLQTTRRIFRSNLERRGPWPIFVALLVLSLGMLPLSLYVELIWWLLGVLGLVGLLGVLRVVRATIDPARHLQRQYLERVSHSEKLGLQAVIGDDLKALLAGWLRWNRGADARSPWLTRVLLATGILAVTLGLWIGLGGLHAWLAKDRIAIIRICVCGAWLALSSLVTLWLLRSPGPSDRLLLVVDDLDRCQPAHISVVVESLKLMAEASDLQGCVQVAALVEEDALDWALRERFRTRSEYFGAKDLTSKHSADRLVHEHIQKLFLGYIRLPALTVDELTEVFKRYLYEGATADSPLKSAVDNTFATGAPTKAPAGASPVILNYVHRSRDAPMFSPGERSALLEIFPRLITSQTNCGPRALRSFLFRYQIARVLLTIRGRSDISHEMLASILLVDTEPLDDPDLLAIAAMVR